MTILVRLIVLLIALAGVAGAKQDPREARDRWERMPHEERAKFVERFEEYRTLPPEKRAKLAERAKRLEGLRAELVKELPAEVRARLEQMTPLERAEALREFMERRLEERGRHVRGFLPRELRERIENAPPDQREPLVREFCEHTRREDGRRMLDALARRLELAPEEVARIEALPEDQHFEAVMELRRRVIERDVAEEGLPTWLEAAEWADVQELPTRQFFERFHDLRRDRCGREHDGGPGGPRFGPPRRGEHSPGARELFEPDPAWRDEAERLPNDQRRGFLEAKLRERILERLAARPELIRPEQLELLRTKQGAEFQAALRETLRGSFETREKRSPRERR